MLIAFNKLYLSDSNVRKTRSDADDAQLSADIEARGLLQNLIVTKGKKRGTFAVIAGGRRLRAIEMIVERGAWQPETEVECKLIDGKEAEAGEVSLAENFQRVGMSPAEECRAFQHFITEGSDVAAVAQRFGLTQRFVEGRLRLANLAEPIFAALAAGDISLDHAKAYASTTCHDTQLRTYEQYRYGYNVSAEAIRRAVASTGLSGASAIALLVGEDAYTAAGGRIERDLFTETSDDCWLDADIARKLAADTMEAEAGRLTAETGLAWIAPVAGPNSWTARSAMNVHPVRLPPAPVSDEAQARITAIETRLAEINDLYEQAETEGDDGEIDWDALEAELDALNDEHEALENPITELPDDWRSQVGRFLILANDGTMVLQDEYFSETQLRFEQAEDGNLVATAEERSGRSSSVSESTKPSHKPESVAPGGGKPISARLFDELAVQRRNVLAASLLADPGLALDYAIFAMCDKGWDGAGTTIRAPRADDPVNDAPAGLAESLIAEADDSLDKRWQEPGSAVDRFLAFRALDDDAKAAWLAFTVATSLEAKKSPGSEYHPIHAVLGSLLDIDVAALWRPTSENFFDRIPKGACLAALADVGGSELTGRYAASKKHELSASCQKLFSGDAIVEPEIRERAIAWLPEAMKFAPATPAAIEDDASDTNPDTAEPDDSRETDNELVDDPAEAAAIDTDTTAAEEAVLTA